MSDRTKRVGHAFLSYVRYDVDRVDRLQRVLEAAEIPAWRDTAGLWPGEDWRMKIRHAITGDALVFIACFSEASLARAKSYQNEELVLAIEQLRLRRPEVPWLIPVRFDECDLPDWDIGGGRTLASIQRADVFVDRFGEGAARLAAAVLRILGHQDRSECRPDMPKTFEDWFSEGEGFLDAQMYSDALTAFENAITSDPRSGKAYCGKGWALWNLKRYSESLMAHDRAIGIDPSLASAYQGRGAALSNLERHFESMKAFDRAIELDPSRSFLYAYLYEYLHLHEHYAEADYAKRRARELGQPYKGNDRFVKPLWLRRLW